MGTSKGKKKKKKVLMRTEILARRLIAISVGREFHNRVYNISYTVSGALLNKMSVIQ